MKNLGLIASVFGLLCVALGAITSHWLKTKVSIEKIDSFNTAIYFLFFHVLLFFAFSLTTNISVSIQKSLLVIFIGISLFSGSIFILTFKHALHFTLPSNFHFVTPIGGVILMIGWGMMIIGQWRNKY